jgi:hypothetical protein
MNILNKDYLKDKEDSLKTKMSKLMNSIPLIEDDFKYKHILILLKSIIYFILGNLIGQLILFLTFFKSYMISFYVLKKSTKLEALPSNRYTNGNVDNLILTKYKNKIYLLIYRTSMHRFDNKQISILPLENIDGYWVENKDVKYMYISNGFYINWILYLISYFTGKKLDKLYKGTEPKSFNLNSIQPNSYKENQYTEHQYELKTAIRKLRISTI